MNSLIRSTFNKNSRRTISLFQYPERNILFLRRLQNKPVKRQSNNQHQYDDEEYIKAMKKFQKEARGIVPGSKEYDEIRNTIYRELRQNRFKKVNDQASGPADIMTADFSSFYILLVVVPEETDCYETSLVLNYFGFPTHIEEDNILKPRIRQEMGFKNDDQVTILTFCDFSTISFHYSSL